MRGATCGGHRAPLVDQFEAGVDRGHGAVRERGLPHHRLPVGGDLAVGAHHLPREVGRHGEAEHLVGGLRDQVGQWHRPERLGQGGVAEGGQTAGELGVAGQGGRDHRERPLHPDGQPDQRAGGAVQLGQDGVGLRRAWRTAW